MNEMLTMPNSEPHHHLLADRKEYVYRIAPEYADQFEEVIGDYLEADPYGRHPLDAKAPHFVTTLYFDSDNHEIARACENGGDNVKLRAREYSQLSVDSGPCYRPQLWFEVKSRVGMRTRKNRFAIPSYQVRDFLHDGTITKSLIAIHREQWGESAEIVFAEIAELCHKIRGPLRPSCLAHYRRRAWQSEDGWTRVTLDTNIEFYRVPPEMFDDFMTLNQAVTGYPLAAASHGVVEIKMCEEFPPWLPVLLRECSVDVDSQPEARFSKFIAASRAIADAG